VLTANVPASGPHEERPRAANLTRRESHLRHQRNFAVHHGQFI
jgi:hypothetical protein